jgi:B12-binding domain/radical SAM domain protein
MAKPDIILLHAPHVYDFRKIPQLYGPVSDLVLATPVFEMYPVGLASISEYLEKGGFNARVVNIAWRMIRNAKFDAEKFIAKLEAPIFGIDLHWMVHCHGSIEIARIVKKYHPNSKIIFGGYSSSRFYNELIQYPEVDFILRGDSTEVPFLEFMKEFNGNKDFSKIPNLCWKNERNEPQFNDFSYVPNDIRHVMGNHYSQMVRQVIKYHDFASVVPFKGWIKYPVTAVFTTRGCQYNCIFCGGARDATPNYLNRTRPARRAAEDIVKDIVHLSKITRAPILLVGDIREGGEERANRILDLIKLNKVKNTLMFEAFNPWTREFTKKVADCCPGFSLDMSPESHDPEVRSVSLGRNFTNEAMEEMIGAALEFGACRVEIFFMIGLWKQDRKNVMDNIDYCDELMTKFHDNPKLFLFMGHQAPFMAPGCLAFDFPERYGFKLRFKTLEEHRQALAMPSWRYSLNYETKWLPADDITEVTYDAIRQLTVYKAKHGLLAQDLCDTQLKRIDDARAIEKQIDELVAKNDKEGLLALKPEMDRINGFKAAERLELEIPIGTIVNLRYFSAVKHALFEKNKKIKTE